MVQRRREASISFQQSTWSHFFRSFLTAIKPRRSFFSIVFYRGKSSLDSVLSCPLDLLFLPCPHAVSCLPRIRDAQIGVIREALEERVQDDVAHAVREAIDVRVTRENVARLPLGFMSSVKQPGLTRSSKTLRRVGETSIFLRWDLIN